VATDGCRRGHDAPGRKPAACPGQSRQPGSLRRVATITGQMPEQSGERRKQLMFEFVEKAAPNAVIKVVGVGGGGGNAVAHMVNNSVDGVEFICANTDAQAISSVGAKTLLQLGGNVTKGLGAGANPEVGRQAALEDRERIQETLQGADMVFITAGMGGGTGTGAA